MNPLKILLSFNFEAGAWSLAGRKHSKQEQAMEKAKVNLTEFVKL